MTGIELPVMAECCGCARIYYDQLRRTVESAFETGRSPERAQQVMQKWMAWFKELAERGHIKDRGQPLERTGKLAKGKQKTVTDGSFAEAKDVVGGFTLIEARDLDQAVELAKGCPIFEVWKFRACVRTLQRG